jgi:hypothetical protein
MPSLKATADNPVGTPEGTFTSAATEADPVGNEDEAGRTLSPMMTEAVGPLATAMAGKRRPLAWTSLQLAGSTTRQCVRKKSIPKMAMDTSANKSSIALL